MHTLIDYFNNDFSGLNVTQTVNMGDVEGKFKTITDPTSCSRSVAYYLPPIPNNETFMYIVELLRNYKKHYDDSVNFVKHISNDRGEINLGAHRTIQSNRIFFCCENDLSQDELDELDKIGNASGMLYTIRSQDWVKSKQMSSNFPIAFISHDSRDKDLIARPLAFGLMKQLSQVWFDEFSLGPGDSLKDSIEQGIKISKKCILVLTQNFLDNRGWSKKEFDSIFTREMIFTERIVIPIWYQVTKEQVYEYSPSLADTLAVIWPSRDGLTDEEYNQKVQTAIYKVNVSLNK